MSRLLLWFLFVSLAPAGPELVEWTVHYLQEGDFADRPDAGHRRAPDDQQEHGCAVVLHGCGCHSPTAPVTATDRTVPAFQLSHTVQWPSVDLTAERPTPQPTTPPPIG